MTVSGRGRWTIDRDVAVVSMIVRLWPGPEGSTEWRGEVRHVPTGKSARFTSLSQLSAVVETFLKDSAGQRVIPDDAKDRGE